MLCNFLRGNRNSVLNGLKADMSLRYSEQVLTLTQITLAICSQLIMFLLAIGNATSNFKVLYGSLILSEKWNKNMYLRLYQG